MKPAVFLDRDGVINVERGAYTFKPEDFLLVEGLVESLIKLKEAGYLLIVITNQAGIAKGLYTAEDVIKCHQKLQDATGNIIDDLYFSPYHPNFSESLSRKPGSLLFEKAIAKHSIDPQLSWMIGDKERDLIPAKKLGIKTILFNGKGTSYADYEVEAWRDVLEVILEKEKSN